VTAATVRFLQRNDDRRQIYALVEHDDRTLAYGPLAMDQVYRNLYESPRGLPARGVGDESLARELVSRSDEFHELDDFYQFHGYSPEVMEWVDSTDPTLGRPVEEVAERLGVDLASLADASWPESFKPGSFDPEGNPVFYPTFWENFAVGDMAGQYDINPASIRFKAWLSLYT
jgi:hypothetical protein